MLLYCLCCVFVLGFASGCGVSGKQMINFKGVGSIRFVLMLLRFLLFFVFKRFVVWNKQFQEIYRAGRAGSRPSPFCVFTEKACMRRMKAGRQAGRRRQAAEIRRKSKHKQDISKK